MGDDNEDEMNSLFDLGNLAGGLTPARGLKTIVPKPRPKPSEEEVKAAASEISAVTHTSLFSTSNRIALLKQVEDGVMKYLPEEVKKRVMDRLTEDSFDKHGIVMYIKANPDTMIPHITESEGLARLIGQSLRTHKMDIPKKMIDAYKVGDAPLFDEGARCAAIALQECSVELIVPSMGRQIIEDMLTSPDPDEVMKAAHISLWYTVRTGGLTDQATLGDFSENLVRVINETRYSHPDILPKWKEKLVMATRGSGTPFKDSVAAAARNAFAGLAGPKDAKLLVDLAIESYLHTCKFDECLLKSICKFRENTLRIIAKKAEDRGKTPAGERVISLRLMGKVEGEARKIGLAQDEKELIASTMNYCLSDPSDQVKIEVIDFVRSSPIWQKIEIQQDYVEDAIAHGSELLAMKAYGFALEMNIEISKSTLSNYAKRVFDAGMTDFMVQIARRHLLEDMLPYLIETITKQTGTTQQDALNVFLCFGTEAVLALNDARLHQRINEADYAELNQMLDRVVSMDNGVVAGADAPKRPDDMKRVGTGGPREILDGINRRISEILPIDGVGRRTVGRVLMV